ncbi:MAG TPA: DUF1573 domain-containing protein, partial [Thermoanaerobaculia bacterium]|nr:DUF1573 domain-containing protein [Thermoanaerobaculia bacterium]
MNPFRFRSFSRLVALFAAALLPLGFAATARAQGAATPKAVITDDKKDAGTVPKGELIKHTFLVKNTGTADLLITDVKPACGCTVTEYDKVIKPGTEGKIALTIETKTFTGPIAKTALVLTNDPTMPQLTLHISAIVKPYVEAAPYGFFRIQALTGESVSSEMILGSDDPAFAPSKIEVPYKFLRTTLAEASEKERLPGKGAKQ